MKGLKTAIYLKKFCIPDDIMITRISNFYNSDIHIQISEIQRIFASPKFQKKLIKIIFTSISVSILISWILQKCVGVMVITLIILFFGSISSIVYFILSCIQNLNKEFEAHGASNYDKKIIQRTKWNLTLGLYILSGFMALSVLTLICFRKEIRISISAIKVKILNIFIFRYLLNS